VKQKLHISLRISKGFGKCIEVCEGDKKRHPSEEGGKKTPEKRLSNVPPASISKIRKTEGRTVS